MLIAPESGVFLRDARGTRTSLPKILLFFQENLFKGKGLEHGEKDGLPRVAAPVYLQIIDSSHSLAGSSIGTLLAHLTTRYSIIFPKNP